MLLALLGSPRPQTVWAASASPNASPRRSAAANSGFFTSLLYRQAHLSAKESLHAIWQASVFGVYFACLERRSHAGMSNKRAASLTREATQDMVPIRLGGAQPSAVLALAAICLILVQICAVGCATPRATGAVTEVALPPEAAATLTAWPTHPPVVTRAPTAAPVPKSLWSTSPSPIAPLVPGSGAETLLPGDLPASTLSPARIVIATLGLDVPVVEVAWSVTRTGEGWRSEWQSADHAAGHLRGTANPGETGNMVIAGHHNSKGEVFRPLSDVGLPGNPLRQGDTIVIATGDGKEFHYQVALWDRFLEATASPEEIRRHARYLDQTESPTLTLVTCWPYDSNTHRVVIIAHLAP